MIDEFDWSIEPCDEYKKLVLKHVNCSGQYVEMFHDKVYRCFGCGKVVSDEMLNVALLVGAKMPNHDRILIKEEKRWADYPPYPEPKA